MKNEKLKYKNYVFDMGGVLVECDEELTCLKYTKDIDLANEIFDKIFGSIEYAYLEMGIISANEAWDCYSKKFNNTITREIAKKAFFHWPMVSVWPIMGMEPIIKELKEKGAKLYVLSNINEMILQVDKKKIPGYKYFDGMFYSFNSGYIKPQEEIYSSFLNKYKLKAKECFYVDDRKWNVDAAKKIGMNVYFQEQIDILKLRKVLGLNTIYNK